MNSNSDKNENGVNSEFIDKSVHERVKKNHNRSDDLNTIDKITYNEEKENILYNYNFINDFYKNEDMKNTTNVSKTGKYVLDINKYLKNIDQNIPITLDILEEKFENFPKNKVSSKDFGVIKSYAANTSQGIIRDYNEDRVTIIINLAKPSTCNIKDSDWPKISFFGVFDGHGGSKCADYLKDNLLSKIVQNIHFPKDIKNAIKKGFEISEKEFLENYAVEDGKIIDNSGSCALILLIINETLYVANLGDSRCVISLKNGRILKDVTRDHKPSYPYEKERILLNNGALYQTETPINYKEDNIEIFKDKVILGPIRVNPGRLSVSRTIGDAEAKIPAYGGKLNVIISEPDIYTYNLEKEDVDFVLMGCDGIYDKLSSKEILDCAWMLLNDPHKKYNKDLNSSCGNIVDMILRMAMISKSYDNVTCVMAAFKGMEKLKKRYTNKNLGNLIPLIDVNMLKEKNLKLKKYEKTILFHKKIKLPNLKLKIQPNISNKKKNKNSFKKLNLESINLNNKNSDMPSARFCDIHLKRNDNIYNRNKTVINKIKERVNYSQVLVSKPFEQNKFLDGKNINKSNYQKLILNKINDKKSINNSIGIIPYNNKFINGSNKINIKKIKNNRKNNEYIKNFVSKYIGKEKISLFNDNNFINNSSKYIKNKNEHNIKKFKSSDTSHLNFSNEKNKKINTSLNNDIKNMLTFENVQKNSNIYPIIDKNLLKENMEKALKLSSQFAKDNFI